MSRIGRIVQKGGSLMSMGAVPRDTRRADIPSLERIGDKLAEQGQREAFNAAALEGRPRQERNSIIMDALNQLSDDKPGERRTLAAGMRAKLTGLHTELIDTQREGDEIYEDMVKQLYEAGPEELGEILKACGLTGKMTARLATDPELRGNMVVAAEVGRPVAPSDKMHKAMIDILSDYIEKDANGFMVAMQRLSRERKINADLSAATAALYSPSDWTKASVTMQSTSKKTIEDLISDADGDLGRKLVTTLRSEPRATLLEWGAVAAKLLGDGDHEAYVKLQQAIAGQLAARSRHAFGFEFIHSRRDPEYFKGTMIEVGSAWIVRLGYEWARCGFPMIRPTHKLAASLMATSIPKELVPEVARPWRTFAVLVPDGLLPPNIIHDDLGTFEIKMVGLLEGPEGELIMWAGATTHAILSTWRAGSLADLVSPEPVEGEGEKSRALREVVGRLLLGVLVELDQPKQREAIREGPPAKHAKREAAEPSAWSFELRRDVQVDLRPWVRSYVSGGGRSQGVQVLVRGHHKRQVCGVGRKDRKWIHIEPFWRGPIDAPIVVRGIVVEEADG